MTTSDAWDTAARIYAEEKRSGPELAALVAEEVRAYPSDAKAWEICSRIIADMAMLHFCVPNPEAYLNNFAKNEVK